MAYYYIFPFGVRELSKLAYFFEFDYADGREVNTYLAETRRAVDGWVRLHVDPAVKPVLDAVYAGPDQVTLTDTRACAVHRVQHLKGLKARLYYKCDTAQTPESLARSFGVGETVATIRGLLDEMTADGLLYGCDGRYLSLAVMRQRPPDTQHGAEDVELPLRPAATSEPLLHSV